MTNTAGESRHFKTSDGVKLHYLEAGSGSALVLVPGWSQSAEQFKYQLEGLSDRYHCIAVDMRGHARSNSANTASIPASALPLGVVRSSASQSDTNPTSSAFSSWSVFTRSPSDRPQRSSRQTRTRSISRRRAASMSFSRCGRVVAPDPTSLTSRRRPNSSSLHSPASPRAAGAVSSGRGLRRERRAPPVQKPPYDRGLKLAVFSGVWACHNGMSENYSLFTGGPQCRSREIRRKRAILTHRGVTPVGVCPPKLLRQRSAGCGQDHLSGGYSENLQVVLHGT